MLQAKRGTPCYMAPELFQDGSTHSSAADLWALGCVLYECAAGHPPFVSTSFNHLVNDILTGTPADLPSKLSPSQDPCFAGVKYVHRGDILRYCLTA